MDSKLEALKNKYFHYSIIRWGMVGLLTNGIDYFLFITFYESIKSVFIANLLSVSISTTINYFAHHNWTFKSDQKHSKSGFKYILNLIFWWFISTSIIKLLITMGLNPKISKIIPLIVVAPLNFYVLNKLIFRKK